MARLPSARPATLYSILNGFSEGFFRVKFFFPLPKIIHEGRTSPV